MHFGMLGASGNVHHSSASNQFSLSPCLSPFLRRVHEPFSNDTTVSLSVWFSCVRISLVESLLCSVPTRSLPKLHHGSSTSHRLTSSPANCPVLFPVGPENFTPSFYTSLQSASVRDRAVACAASFAAPSSSPSNVLSSLSASVANHACKRRAHLTCYIPSFFAQFPPFQHSIEQRQRAQNRPQGVGTWSRRLKPRTALTAATRQPRPPSGASAMPCVVPGKYWKNSKRPAGNKEKSYSSPNPK